MEEKIMYRYTLPHGNAARIGKSPIEEVTVSVGRKYFTDERGRRYEKSSQTGAFHIPFHPLVTTYCNDFCLFETKEQAEDAVRGEELLKSIGYLSLRKLPIRILEEIASSI